MKLHAFAIIAALAMPALASADPVPPTSKPDTGAQPVQSLPSQDKDPGKDMSKDMPKTGDTGKPGKLGDADVKTIAHLHHVNQMEITLGQQAQKSGTAHIKDYATKLVSDHQSADKDLTAFAKTHKLAAIPADKPMTETDRQDDKDMTTSMAHLKTLKGAEYDKEYLNMMVSGHDKELTKIDTAISSAGDADLKSLLEGVKPVLQRHADQARDLQNSPQAALDPNTPVDHLPSASH